MSWHTREEFDRRMAVRRDTQAKPLPMVAWWHCALLPGWRPIVREQLALCAHVGLTELRSYVLAEARTDVLAMLEMAGQLGVNVRVVGASGTMAVGEGATLNELFAAAKSDPEGSTLYFHTKGASAPECPHKRHWRRVMMRHVVAEWEHNLGKLAVDDLVGCAWQQSPDYPHFCGNFWAARNDWLASLPHPDEYRFGRPDFQWAGTPHSWQRRIYVETWVGSRPYHSVHDRVGFDFPLWSHRVHEVTITVPGFDWDASYKVQ